MSISMLLRRARLRTRRGRGRVWSPLASLLTAGLLLSLLSVGGLHAAPTSEESATDGSKPPLSVEEILTRDPQTSDYVDTPRCISSHRIRSVEVLDDRHLAFRTGSSEYYLVRFRHRCHGLSKRNPVLYETRTSRLCVLDSVRGSYDVFNGLEPGPPCPIPSFQGISKESLLALKDALLTEREAARAARKASRKAKQRERRELNKAVNEAD